MEKDSALLLFLYDKVSYNNVEYKKSIHSWGGVDALIYKGNGRNVHVQTKGVYVWYVIYFTSLSYHEIIDTSTFHNEFNRIVTFVFYYAITAYI